MGVAGSTSYTLYCKQTEVLLGGELLCDLRIFLLRKYKSKYLVLFILPVSSIGLSCAYCLFCRVAFLSAVESVRPWASASANTSYPGELKPNRATLMPWLTGSTLLHSSHYRHFLTSQSPNTADIILKHTTMNVLKQSIQYTLIWKWSNSWFKPLWLRIIPLPWPQPLQALVEVVVKEEIQGLHTLIQALFQGHLWGAAAQTRVKTRTQQMH